MLIVILLLASLVKGSTAHNDIESLIVGGGYAQIKNYSHSVFITVERNKNGKEKVFSCGASILNQAILLTAAHCLVACNRIYAYAGDVQKKHGMLRHGKEYMIHENYHVPTLANDVALVRLEKNLKLGENTKRVVLMKTPPYNEKAAVAGWGIVDDVKKTKTLFLKQLLQQPVQPKKICLKVLHGLPQGTFCAGTVKGKEHIASGDSGSALVVRKIIQIGLVSYRVPTITKSLAVYTDVGYFYNWIHATARKLFCNL